ncbi:hypothetical protein Tco_1569756 [Tanacetum coccineum]
MKNVGREVGLSGFGVEAGEEVSSKRKFTRMSQPSHWIDLLDVRKLSNKLKAKLMVPESVVVPKANVGVEIIIVSDDDNEVVGDTMDTVVAETDDEINSASVGMSEFILEACVDAMEDGSLEATPSGNVKVSGNVGSPQLIPTRQSQRIENQKNTCLCIGVTPDYTPEKAVQQASLEGNMENQLSNVKQSGNEGRNTSVGSFAEKELSERLSNVDKKKKGMAEEMKKGDQNGEKYSTDVTREYTTFFGREKGLGHTKSSHRKGADNKRNGRRKKEK